MLEQCCNRLKQCNNVETLCCAKNRRCESSLLPSPLAEVQCLCDGGTFCIERECQQLGQWYSGLTLPFYKRFFIRVWETAHLPLP